MATATKEKQLEGYRKELADLTKQILQSINSRLPEEGGHQRADIEESLLRALEKLDTDLAAPESQLAKNKERKLKLHRKKIVEWQTRFAFLTTTVASLSAEDNSNNQAVSASGGGNGGGGGPIARPAFVGANSASGGEAPAPKIGGAPVKLVEKPINECQFCFDTFTKANDRIAFCPAPQSPCSGGHNSICKRCAKTYLETEINKGFVGKCPLMYCPEIKHEMPYSNRVIMSYNKWSKVLPEAMLIKYKTFAEGHLMFLCGGCHNSKSQLIPFDEAGFVTKNNSQAKAYIIDKYSSTGGSHAMVDCSFQCPRCNMYGPSSQSGPQKCNLCNICTVCCGKQPTCANAPPTLKESVKTDNPSPIANLEKFALSLSSYELGRLSAGEFYDELLKVHAPKLNMKKDTDMVPVWNLIKIILSIICDPERRASFQIFFWNKYPKFYTLCCSKMHCFRCKTKDFHEGKSCEANMAGMDSSVLPCPSCFVFLAKGDGCDSVTCVCGNRFSWTTELAKFKELTAFVASFPTDTVNICAEILCGGKHHVKVESEWGSIQSYAANWRKHNQPEVDRAILIAWQKRNPLYADQMIAKLMLDETLAGKLNIHACVKDVWNSVHKSKVDKAIKDIKTCSDAMLNGLYPTTLDKYNALSYFISATKSTGRWTVQTNKLDVNVNWMDTDGNTMFHFNTRNRDEQLVMNTMERGIWGREERIPLPADYLKLVKSAKKTPLISATIVVTSEGYEVYWGSGKSSKSAKNRVHLYRHRIPFSKFAKVHDASSNWQVIDLQASFTSRLSSDEVAIFGQLKEFRKTNQAQFEGLERTLNCKAALSFLQLHGGDKVKTSYNFASIDTTSLISFESKKTSWRVGDRVVLSEDYARYSDAAGGPLRPGVVETIQTVRSEGSNPRINVRGWWYDFPAVQDADSSLLSSRKLADPSGLAQESEEEITAFYTGKKGASADAIASSSSDWSCSACTYVNTALMVKCEMCNTAKPTTKRVGGGGGGGAGGGGAQSSLPLKIGDKVVLSSNFEQCGDASEGPLTRGVVGVIIEVDSSGKPYKAMIDDEKDAKRLSASTTKSWWYSKEALIKKPAQKSSSKSSSASGGNGSESSTTDIVIASEEVPLNTFNTRLYIDFRSFIQYVQKTTSSVASPDPAVAAMLLAELRRIDAADADAAPVSAAGAAEAEATVPSWEDAKVPKKNRGAKKEKIKPEQKLEVKAVFDIDKLTWRGYFADVVRKYTNTPTFLRNAKLASGR